MDRSEHPDSAPFVIWTLRRTGGTTLTQLLMTMAPYDQGLHEPFNHDRAFGWVSKAWSETKDLPLLRQNLAKVLDDDPVFKQCYEMQGVPLNKSILEGVHARKYRHVILDRRAETNRLLSLELAKQTGVWGKMGAEKRYSLYESGEAEMQPFDIDWLMRHMRYCRDMRSTIQQLMLEIGVTPYVVYFEDIYVDHDAGRARIDDLVKFLGINKDAVENYQDRVNDALAFKGQNSARMMDFVPNIQEARRKLEDAHEPYEFIF